MPRLQEYSLVGKLVNRAELSEIIGKTPKTITEWQRQDGFPVRLAGKRGSGNQYDTADVIEWLVSRQLHRYANPGGGDESPIVFDVERARLTKEQADNTALKNAQLREELAPIADIESAIAKAAAQIRPVLEALPVRIKRRSPELRSAALDMIRGEIAKTCNTIAALESGGNADNSATA